MGFYEAKAEATKVTQQQYSTNVLDGVPGFANVQFKSNAAYEWAGYDEDATNLFDDANNFSIYLKLDDFIPSASDYWDFDVISTFDDDFSLSLVSNDEGATYYWQIKSDNVNDDIAVGTTPFDGKGGEFIFRSGSDFMDLWRVNGKIAECLVTANFIFDGTDFGSKKFDFDENNLYIGEEFSQTLTSTHIQEATLYNGLYDAGGLIPMPGGSGNIPEPTTATLGLMALAGLMARRRRK